MDPSPLDATTINASTEKTPKLAPGGIFSDDQNATTVGVVPLWKLCYGFSTGGIFARLSTTMSSRATTRAGVVDPHHCEPVARLRLPLEHRCPL
jgi:hypothetical protein